MTDQIEKFMPPQKGKNRAYRVIREMLYFQPSRRGTDAGRALEYFHAISRRRAVIFMISDFLFSGYERPLRLAHKRHDVIPICITDRREISLPNVGFVTLQDLETGEHVLVDTASAMVRRLYRERREAAVAERRQLFRTLGIDAIEVLTDQPYINPLMRFFRLRERRLSQGR